MVRAWAARIETPLGPMNARGSDSLNILEFEENPEATHDDPLAMRLQVELDEYFAGNRTEFTIPLAPRGTEFQHQLWRLISAIPYGSTKTYGDLARELGDFQKTRAVGVACGANPIAILVPCHRVISADGELTGYAGGIERKQRLLEIESRQATLF